MNGSQEVVAIGSAGMTNMKAKMPDRVETLDELKDRLETLFTDSTIDMNAFRTHQLSFVVPGTPKSVISQLSISPCNHLSRFQRLNLVSGQR